MAQVAVGLATVLPAEIGQVVFLLALATLGTTTTSGRLLYASMGISEVEEVIYDTLSDVDYDLDAETGIFCLCRFNPSISDGYDEPIPVYRIPGGYMLQFNPQYRFMPQEMALD